MSAPGRKRPPKVVRPKKSALIWWVGTKFSDVLPLHRLGTKADKTVGATVTLPWKDKVTGKFTKAQAKIMAIDDEKKVHNMIVNSKGELQDLSEKIFHDSVIQQKKTLAENGKMVLSIAKSNKRRTDEKIKNDSGIFNKAMRDGFRGKRGTNIGNSTVTSGTYTQIESEKEVLHEQSYAPGPTIDPVHSDPNSREIRSWRDSNDVNESKGQSFHAESLDDFTAFQAWRRMNAFHNHETQKASKRTGAIANTADAYLWTYS
ncbi:uncharacterized protein LOC107046258 [Diachasma alloeum]|uniref:uncharacterized protein LOC107046258 n=1 Tax=Diachasma alloeum TaxID=454923 RepID=UPI000738177A|nr:uncharacterized protein LOC107046258 [Diachasma alloeum]